ncbi:Por secretion system C-terminal sorting domain-containing protein [Maribacter sedimenticola]|uniref:Por secretion system C-terminal sorting domain-containing protein n=1 Tax=Maribacter sedimenticola TaxID=228956 RepID=A0ABY1SCG9_9FLAO|nr:PQQ-dependent sugar dehydrogenase [Maribacter sedimenticola]SNR25192.1 Por secretion system C-terminal sorting domain-containing protein [Maribacter sedimenticola]
MKNRFLLILTIIISHFISIINAQGVGYENAFPNITFDTPLEIVPSNDGSNRLFIVEKKGFIYQIDEQTGIKTLILDVSDKINAGAFDTTELGLLGMALHPNFLTNKLFYIYYTTGSEPSSVNLAQITLVEGNPSATKSSFPATPIFSDVKQTTHHTHNGGHMEFGPDGYLYIGVGDGGFSTNGGGIRGQQLNHIFGKMLRIQINTNGTYSIPASNPFVNVSGIDDRIWIYGLRNPWKFSFYNNTMWIGDVGADQQDEINRVQPSHAGSNYGWGHWEGVYEDTDINLQETGILRPPYLTKDASSITGGYVYQGNLTNPEIVGKYIFGNHTTGEVWAIDPNISSDSTNPNNATLTDVNKANHNQLLNSAKLFTTASADASIVSFGMNESKTELYFLRYGQNYNITPFNYSPNSGALFKITGQQTNAPTAVQGIGSFDSCDNDLNARVNVIKEINGSLWLGGNFTSAEGLPVSRLVQYNQATGFSATYSISGEVADIHQTTNGDIWLGGNFTAVDGITVSNLVQISNGSIINHNAIGAVFNIDSDTSGNVYFVGGTTSVGGVSINGFGRFNGTIWDDMNTNPNNEFRTIEVTTNGDIYVGGNFTAISGTNASRIAKYDGTNWLSYSGTNSIFVKEIKEINGYLYVGGQGSVGRYNLTTNTHQVLSNDISGEVTSITANGNDIYIGGDFATTSNNGTTDLIMNNLAQWNVSTNEFKALGQGSGSAVGTNAPINDLLFLNNNLYMGGQFNDIGDYFAIWSTDTINCPTNTSCPNDLANEDTSVVLSPGFMTGGLDEAIGISSNTNGSACALQLSNTETGQPWTKFNITIDLASNNLVAGDELFISIDGNSTNNGNARIEVTLDNQPNTAPMHHTFGNGWSTYSQTITIPSGLSTLNIWLFPKYGETTVGTSLFDNLIVQKVEEENDENICYSPSNNGGLSIDEIQVSSFDTGTGPCYLTDGNLNTRWSDYGVGKWAQFDLGSVQQFNEIEIAYFKGDERTATFDLQISNDASNWTNVLTDATSNGTTLNLENFNFPIQSARYIRYYGKGNSSNPWNSITEFKINNTQTNICSSDLPNEDQSVTLTAGFKTGGLDEAIGVSTNTNNSPCALQLSNTETGQPWTRFNITIDLASNNLAPGDELFVSIDGNSTNNGNARIEVNQDNQPNTALLHHTFGSGWSTHSQTITIPSGISTLDIWLFPKYGETAVGTSLFDNLIVQKINTNTICANDLPNDDASVVLSPGFMTAGLDEAVGTNSNTNNSPCALQLSNTETGQPWTRFNITIDLANNSLVAGDELFISIDGNSTNNGNARIEVNQDDQPNTALLYHTFGSGWSTYSQTITIPSGISTLDIWLFPKYGETAVGTSLFDNLIVQKVSTIALKSTLQFNENLNNKELKSVLITPNPSSSIVEIKLPFDSSFVHYQVTSLNGSLLKSGEISDNQQIILLKIEDFENGIYILNLEDKKGGSITYKIVKN